MRFFTEIGEGEKIPKNHGIAWVNVDKKTYITCPMGINIVLGLLKKAYDRIKQNDI